MHLNFKAILAFSTVLSSLIFLDAANAADKIEKASATTPIKIGWVGPMTGICVKYGAYQAAQLAAEDINAAGGISGRPVEFIYEDGQCDGKQAANAAMKLIGVDHVRYIMGGHNSPESLAMTSIAEKNKVVMLAAITSSPKFSNSGAYVSRCTMVSLQGADALAAYIGKNPKIKKLAIIFAETEYAMPVANRLKEDFSAAGGEVVLHESFVSGETDFRSLLMKVKSKKPDALFLGVQSPETPGLFLAQMKQLQIELPLFGNETTGSAVLSDSTHEKSLFEGIVYAEPAFNTEAPATKAFIDRFNQKYATNGLPYGIWTAEAYDCPRLLAQTIARCGDDPEKVSKCIREVRDYKGVSGTFSIGPNGDGEKPFQMKTIKDGKPVALAGL